MDSQEFEICESRCQIACKSVDSSEDCYDSCIYTVCSDAFTAEKVMELYWKGVYLYILIVLMISICGYFVYRLYRDKCQRELSDEYAYYKSIV